MSAILNSPAFAVIILLVGWVLAYGPPKGWHRLQERSVRSDRRDRR